MKCRFAKDLNVFKSVANLISERRKLWARVTFYMQLFWHIIKWKAPQMNFNSQTKNQGPIVIKTKIIKGLD